MPALVFVAEMHEVACDLPALVNTDISMTIAQGNDWSTHLATLQGQALFAQRAMITWCAVWKSRHTYIITLQVKFITIYNIWHRSRQYPVMATRTGHSSGTFGLDLSVPLKPFGTFKETESPSANTGAVNTNLSAPTASLFELSFTTTSFTQRINVCCVYNAVHVDLVQLLLWPADFRRFSWWTSRRASGYNARPGTRQMQPRADPSQMLWRTPLSCGGSCKGMLSVTIVEGLRRMCTGQRRREAHVAARPGASAAVSTRLLRPGPGDRCRCCRAASLGCNSAGKCWLWGRCPPQRSGRREHLPSDFGFHMATRLLRGAVWTPVCISDRWSCAWGCARRVIGGHELGEAEDAALSPAVRGP